VLSWCVACLLPSIRSGRTSRSHRFRPPAPTTPCIASGDELAVRLPRIHWAVDSIAKERKWLPVLAPRVPLVVPVPVAIGEPEARFPYPWSVVRWVAGDLATRDRLSDPVQAALDLAAFLRALQAVDPTGGPTHHRGAPVRLQEAGIRHNVAQLRGEVDGQAVIEAWDRVLAAPDYDGPPRWFHGDLGYLNLLAQDGCLSGVIDWGTCGVGDPAIETIVAWSLFPPDARAAYRDALGVDDATWERGKGWVLTGVGGIPYYRDTNPYSSPTRSPRSKPCSPTRTEPRATRRRALAARRGCSARAVAGPTPW